MITAKTLELQDAAAVRPGTPRIAGDHQEDRPGSKIPKDFNREHGPANTSILDVWPPELRV